MDKDIETLEGGDAASDDEGLGFTEDIVGKAKAAADNDDTDPDDINTPGEWDVAGEDEQNLDWTGDDPKDKDVEEDDEEDVDEEDDEDVDEDDDVDVDDDKEVDKEPEDKQLTEEDKAVQEVLKFLEGKTVIKVKGVEKDIKDLSVEEIRVRLQKGDRFYQEMENLAETRKELDRDRATLNQQAEQVNRLMQTYGKQDPRTQQQKQAQLPPGLQPKEDDTESEKVLKNYIVALAQTVEGLQEKQHIASEDAQSDQMLNEVNSLREDFPLASREEVLAMKAVRPDIATRELMEVSHNHYASDEFLQAYFTANPAALREIEEKAQEKFLSSQQKTKKKTVARKKAGSIVSKKSTSKKKKRIPSNFDQIEALMPQIKKGYRDSLSE